MDSTRLWSYTAARDTEPLFSLVSLQLCRDEINYNGSLKSVSVQVKYGDLKSQGNAKYNHKE
jgi:hypothetical protein